MSSENLSPQSPVAVARNPVGGHVPVAGGLASVGLSYAREIGAEAVQVFVANPRGWATPAGSQRQDEAFREECAAGAFPRTSTRPT